MSEFSSYTEYPFFQSFVDKWKEIRIEYIQISNEAELFHYKPAYNHDWSLYHMVWAEKWLTGKKSKVPVTAKLLEQVPGLWSASFSILEPGTVIYPHVGFTDTVLRAHLGLICPEGPLLKVNNESYSWKEGEMIVFDDSKLHEASNFSNQRRVILIVDFKKENIR